MSSQTLHVKLLTYKGSKKKKPNLKQDTLLCKQKKRKFYDIYLIKLEFSMIEYNPKILLIMSMMD